MIGSPAHELNPHAEFGMHEPYFSFCSDRTIRGTEQQLNPRLCGERRIGSQETSDNTQGSESTAARRILHIFALLAQPFLQTAAGRVGTRGELNAGSPT